jgi:hypothetical protein
MPRRPDMTRISSAGSFLSLAGNAVPPRDPNDDDDEDEDEDEQDERKSDEPAVIREPDEDE